MREIPNQNSFYEMLLIKFKQLHSKITINNFKLYLTEIISNYLRHL